MNMPDILEVTIKQPDDQPIGIDLPIGFKGKLAQSRGFADLDPRISRSGTHDDDHPIGLEAEHDAWPTRSRVTDDGLTTEQRQRVTPKEPLERLRGSSLHIRNKRRQRIRRSRRNKNINY